MVRLTLYFLSLVFYCVPSFSQTCNNWLATPSPGSVVSVGEIDITGTKITVEAIFNRTTSYSGGQIWAGDLVSKHNEPSDCNYLLRPNNAEITTSNGYFRTPDICEIELNKTYHVALVYDGATLKFYRNGVLMSQVSASGNLIQNDWQTRIGWYEPEVFSTQFIGYINEVRIWNQARTQAQLQTYMTSTLPTPTTQPGLLAYYSFNNLLNKQGNAAHNGSLSGAATINATNPACTLVRDSCSNIIGNNRSTIINTYSPVMGIDRCANTLLLEDASTFNAGDTVLLIQMKGASIDSANSSNFGTVTDYKNAGNYELNIIKTKTGQTVELLNDMLRQYDVPLGRVQLVRIPYFQDYTVTDTLTCLPWDGKKGGVLVLNAAGTVTMNNDINVSGRGFRGGSSSNTFSPTASCSENGLFYPAGSTVAAQKGESIYEPGSNYANGKGAIASGGGGGLGNNSGGGGGANGGDGGNGGNQLEACTNSAYNNGGLGASALPYNSVASKIFLGGGGGSGHANNTGGIDRNGGNGGGIAIIFANSLNSNLFKIKSNGAEGQACNVNTNNCHDAGGGGGAGGTILLQVVTYTVNTNVEAIGGKGADVVQYNPAMGEGRIGPGGGGGGGLTWIADAAVPVNLLLNNAGGANGAIIADGNNSWGASAGAMGQQLINLGMPLANVQHKKNIDSVRISPITTGCNSFLFVALGFTTTNIIQNWQWDFGDNSTASTQMAPHTYSQPGTYTVSLKGSDANGCIDSTSMLVSTIVTRTDFSYSLHPCTPLSVQFSNNPPTPLTNPLWQFGDGGTSNGSFHPVHAYADTGNYTVQFTAQSGACLASTTKTISLNIVKADIITSNDTVLCLGVSRQLFTKPALSFCWSPTNFLDNPLLPNPTTSATAPITYYFTAEMEGANSVVNGDFSLGNTGFTSGYQLANPTVAEGEYFVGSSPGAWNSSVSACSDHTTGAGNMLLVNGSSIQGTTVWQQTINVTPHTNYAFATWLQALSPTNPAQLSFSINGIQIGNTITAPLPTCTWNRFYSTWNSGNYTSVVIAIVNENSNGLGNDFALDDISFSPVTIQRDSVNILIDTAQVHAGADTLVCGQNPVQLQASGAVQYSWLPHTGLNNPLIGNPVSTVSDTTQYIVQGISAWGCTAADTVVVNTLPSPKIISLPDTAYCKGASLQLAATGGNTYSWWPASGLSNTGIPNPITQSDTSITYIVSGTSNGCTGYDTLRITVMPNPVINSIADTGICLGDSIILTSTGAATYSWFPTTGLSNAAVSNPVATPVGSIQYVVTGTDANGCSGTDTVQVFTRPLPVVSAGNDARACANTAVALSASGAAAYSWMPANGLSNATISNPLASPADTTQYVITGTDIFGCSNTDTLVFFTLPLPVIGLTNDSTVCGNTSLQLTASGGISYQWLPTTGLDNATIANPLATISSSTIYRVLVTGSNTCVAQDSVAITVHAAPAFSINADTSACANQPTQLLASGGTQYAWQPANLLSNAAIANPIANSAASTTYYVIITNNTCNQSDTLSTTVSVLPGPPVQANKLNDIDCANASAQLIASGADEYNWWPAQQLTNSTTATPVANPAASTLYTVTGTNASTGCTATDTITVFVTKINANSLFIPSAFTPNNDPYNNCWKPKFPGSLLQYALTIYNRYGQLVFYSEDSNACWNGSFKGKALPIGNYVYILHYKTWCREETKKGNVLLIR